MFTNRAPTALSKLIDPERDVEDYRSLLCEDYGTCLDAAVDHEWTSWTCVRCPVFENAPKLRAIDRSGAGHTEPVEATAAYASEVP